MIDIEILVYLGLFFTLYFGIFVFLTFFENRKRLYKKEEEKELPQVTLLVPCFNEEKNVNTVLGSLVGLDYPQDKLDIIVIDDGSEDGTLQKAKAFQRNYSNIRVFHKENGGKYTALNYGLRVAKGEFIGCLDADCYTAPDSLRKIVKYFENKTIACVIATIKVAQPKNILEGVQYAEYLISAFLKKIFSFLDSISVTPGPLSVFRKEVFEKLGPYKEAHMTEDLEMAFRLQSKNMKIAHALEALVYTQGQTSVKGLFRQRLRWRRGFLLNLKDYPGLLNLKKHGNLSFLLLYNLFGALLSVTLVGYGIFKFGRFLFEKIGNAWLIKFDLWPLFSFDSLHLPSINVRPAFLLGIVTLMFLLVFLFLGKRLTFDKVNLKKKTVFYVLVYSFLNASWWVLATFSVLLRKEISWE